MLELRNHQERTMKDLNLQRLQPEHDTAALLELYRRAIADIDDGLYSEPEKQLWIQWADTPEVADQLLRQGITLLAEKEGYLRGFAQLTSGHLINMLYVDPESSRQGVGFLLIQALVQIARHRNAARIHTQASHASRSLFERAGFSVEGPAAINASPNVCIARTAMVKDLCISRQ